jgi:hypothetical protein
VRKVQRALPHESHSPSRATYDLRKLRSKGFVSTKPQASVVLRGATALDSSSGRAALPGPRS